MELGEKHFLEYETPNCEEFKVARSFPTRTLGSRILWDIRIKTDP